MDSQLAYFRYLTHRTRLSRVYRSFYIRDVVRKFSGLVLDIGCGAGEFLESYPNSIGVDFNPYLAIYCFKRGSKTGVASILQLPFPNRVFNGVLIANVLEHLDDPGAAFSEAARVLRPGGTIVVTVPFRAGFRHDPTHVHFLQKKDLLEFSSQSQLEPVKVYSYPHLGPFFGNFFTYCELRAVFLKP